MVKAGQLGDKAKNEKRGKGIMSAINKIEKHKDTKVHATEETIKELSNTKIARYMHKAVADHEDASNARSTTNNPTKVNRTITKRRLGLQRAAKKLTIEQIEEISKALARSYMHKAANDHSTRTYRADRIEKHQLSTTERPNMQRSARMAWKSIADKDRSKAASRLKGIGLAAKRLNKEESIDELSQRVLRSYRDTAEKKLFKDKGKLRQRAHGINRAEDRMTGKRKFRFGVAQRDVPYHG
jgi:hypothetical protein